VRGVIACGVLVAGCTFQVPAAPVDAAMNPIDMATLPDLKPAYCDEPGVVGCWQFEDALPATIAHDGSSNHNDLTLTSATFVAGRAGGALFVGTGSLAHAPKTASMDVALVTIEAWVNPLQLPSSGRAGVLDVDGQYSIFLYPPGTFRCGGPGTVFSPDNTVKTNQWQHLACVYDGTAIHAYYNGAQVAELADPGPLPTGSANGLSVGADSPSGDNFFGTLDDVRVLGVARPPGAICDDAGCTL
jgi:Concanavalin A-like lectin/glucanases superfamily